jgi:hypothetical protein
LERKNSKNISDKGFSHNLSSFPCKLVFAGVFISEILLAVGWEYQPMLYGGKKYENEKKRA